MSAVTTVWERVNEGVCRRSFSSPEALLYEAMIAPALCDLVAPVVLAHLRFGPVIDIGCGGGRLVEAIAQARAVTAIGIDPSDAQMRRLARRRSSARVQGTRASAMALPFASARFAGVVSSCAVKHWPDPTTGFAECLRVTRPGGVIVIVEIDGTATPDEVHRLAAQLRLPRPIRAGYVRFAMRTVVGVAPHPDVIADGLCAAGAIEVEHHAVHDSPLTVCVARRA